jgi:ubiquinone/menaquinone biosynthesis C-methylase UbiE
MPATSTPEAYINAVIQNLEQANPLREPTLRSIIAALNLTPGSYGLDIGCGIGLQTLLLAEAINPGGRVTGLDISAELLTYAQNRIKVSLLSEQISFKEGNWQNLPFPDNTFDWVWSADCVGYPSSDLPAALNEIIRVLRPGGRVAILAWTSQQILPGYPLLEAQLNATCSAYTPLLQGKNSESHFMRALRSFQEAGITEATARTFVGEVQAPLRPEHRTAMTALLEMLWNVTSPEIAESDRREYQRLCHVDSPDFILNLPGYYAFFTYTVFSGKVSK